MAPYWISVLTLVYLELELSYFEGILGAGSQLQTARTTNRRSKESGESRVGLDEWFTDWIYNGSNPFRLFSLKFGYRTWLEVSVIFDFWFLPPTFAHLTILHVMRPRRNHFLIALLRVRKVLRLSNSDLVVWVPLINSGKGPCYTDLGIIALENFGSKLVLITAVPITNSG